MSETSGGKSSSVRLFVLVRWVRDKLVRVVRLVRFFGVWVRV